MHPVFCCDFHQSIRSLSNPQKCENSPINMSCHGLFGQVRKSISDRKDKIMDLLEENRILLSEEGEVTTLTQSEPKSSVLFKHF